MPHWKTLKAREFLGAADLMDRGDVTVVIDHVKQGLIPVAGKSKKDRQPVAMLRGKEGLRPWVINTTNGNIIESVLGTGDYTKWAGARITLYLGTARNPQTGTTGPAVRVRPVAPKGESSRPVALEAPPPEAGVVEMAHDDEQQDGGAPTDAANNHADGR